MTIKERAMIYTAQSINLGADEMSYVEGATEQQKIDIEKACEWLYSNYWSEASQKEFVDDFRKAMSNE